MNLKTVTKRSGHTVPYNREKIYHAIAGANSDGGNTMSEKDIDEVTSQVEWDIKDRDNVSVEEIQDIVEQELMKYDFYDIAKKYITYRQKHAERRAAQKHLMESYRDIFFADSVDSDLKRDNANINTDASMGIMLKLGAEGAKHFVDNYVLDEEYAEADRENYIHIHDKDFSLITFNCCQIDLLKLFHGGFSTGHGFLREPNSIRAYASLACIAIQSNQNDMFGGQSINAFDYAMAEGVRKSFRKAIFDEAHKALIYRFGMDPFRDYGAFKAVFKEHLSMEHCHFTESDDDPKAKESMDTLVAALEATLADEYHKPTTDVVVDAANIYHLACADVVEETHQAMEALIHNFNTLHSRAGAQVPFSSINYGMDTSPEGRLVISEVLNAIWAGLGYGETPIFPISVFQLKAGVNYNPGDANYDLFLKACKVSAKRLFPNFVNIDAPYNLQYYKPGDYNSEVAYMGCRTRVLGNVYDKDRQVTCGRGNLSFTSINLPRLGLEAQGDVQKFFALLDDRIDLVFRQLMHRLKIQSSKKVRNYPFLMGEGIWLDSEKLGWDDSIEEVLKHGTLSMGFIGLAEALMSLRGKHHGESEESQKLGLEIIGHMRKRCDDESEKTGLNFSLIATPAESLSGRFVSLDKGKFGSIPGITDRDYYTNSFHVPVYCHIKAFKKIEIEAPYHELTNAGHITYVELDGDTCKNPEAFERIIRFMHDHGVGYGSVNHPLDRDPLCGYVGVINDCCPRCGRKEGEGVSAELLDELRKKYPHIPQWS